ncbi:MAG: tetratricopeptide repeat protein [Rhodomicrobium sp.]|nr:tetratricopeptide repeat protein [Rhodomicrobium sp.]
MNPEAPLNTRLDRSPADASPPSAAPTHDADQIAAAMLLKAGHLGAAAATFERVIEANPQNWLSIYLLGYIRLRQGSLDLAARHIERCLAINPAYAEAHCDLGIVLRESGDLEGARARFETAIALKPGFHAAHNNLGNILMAQGRLHEAVESYRRALELMPNSADGYANLGGVLRLLNRIEDATAMYRQALTIDGNHSGALVAYYHLRRDACDWDGLDSFERKILDETFRKGHRVPCFPILNLAATAEDHLISARAWAKGIKSPLAEPFAHAPARRTGSERRLRIGYLSGDFRRHATARLISELIERHDRTRFEVFGYCFSQDDASEERQRLIGAFDRFVPIDALSHGDAARRIDRDGIDILIDLKGYTAGARTEILAARPAPIQVNYLGYPSTMGAPFIDYIIADAFVAPMERQPFFDERIVHLPDCYQPNDTKRPIADSAPSRAECGLPGEGFVFCSFNGSYKITPELFGLWMRLLARVPGSVLWLLGSNALMQENLRRRAALSGIDPLRLVFAPKLEFSQHLARHRHADLFLDTLPVNAHTTASAALWAGLPVLTCVGDIFVSRVCGSLLKALDLSELITYSLDHYECLALELALDPNRLGEIRSRLARNRDAAPLFDIARYTEGFEAAFGHMAELRERGERPRAFAVNR